MNAHAGGADDMRRWRRGSRCATSAVTRDVPRLCTPTSMFSSSSESSFKNADVLKRKSQVTTMQTRQEYTSAMPILLNEWRLYRGFPSHCFTRSHGISPTFSTAINSNRFVGEVGPLACHVALHLHLLHPHLPLLIAHRYCAGCRAG